MNKTLIEINGIEIQIIRKKIKNLHLSVYPPDGRVRAAVPEHFTDDNVRLAFISRLSWVKKKQSEFKNQQRQSERMMVSGESHYFFGKRYRLEIIERHGKHEVLIKNYSSLQVFITPNTTARNRQVLLNEWYRTQLKKRIGKLISKWEVIIGAHVNEFSIKRMKTKWGSCNIEKRRIWINLELAKKSPQCLEYIVVHEMVHLLERHHNEKFKKYMNKFLPQWQICRDVLKSEPLSHEDWQY